MTGDRRARILAQLIGDDGTVDLATGTLCKVSARITGASGAGIMLMTDDVPRGTAGVSNEVSAFIEELQFELGEGPCIDAYRGDRPVLEPDLARPSMTRWLAFSPPALERGVRAIFGFPLQVGSVRLGGLNLYRDRPGPLTDDQYADALVLADVVAQALLVLQANAPEGELAAALREGADLQAVVHQASGMVAAQLEVSVAQALIRLRAHAFGNGRPLVEVAKAVVSRDLRFDARSGESDAAP